MLFAVTYTYRASASEATVKRLNTLFGNWRKADCRRLIFEEK